MLLMNDLHAQKKPFYNENNQVIEAANNALNNSLKSGDFKEWADKYGMKGNYTFNITIGGTKGEVYTVHALERTGEVNQQNALKDHVKNLRFPFKMPKDRSYQFQYEFKF
jgi:hypothetical protein